MLREALVDDDRFVIGSAGLRAVVGAPMDPMAAEELRLHGGNPQGLFGEQLDDARIDAANLILTMTISQRDHLIRKYPRAAQRTFTIAEFAALAPTAVRSSAKQRSLATKSVQPRTTEVVAAASKSRFTVRLTPDHDVPDPINASPEVHAQVAVQIATLVQAIASELTGAPSSNPV